MALVGATASGKSNLAFAIAKSRGDCEIVSVDSMAVYRKMDIATAKPPLWQREAVNHHMIDLLDPWQESTVSWFQAAADTAIDDIEGRANNAILVGGTGLYHRAVIDRLDIPQQYPEIRRELEARAEEDPSSLHRQLEELDPEAARKMEVNNARRIVRALEVVLGSGRTFSSFGPGLEQYDTVAVEQIGLGLNAENQDAAILARIDSWLEDGFADELDLLLALPQGLSRTAVRAIGYEPFLQWRQGDLSLDRARELTLFATRQYARRQRAWFRRDPRIKWCDSIDQARELIEQRLDASSAEIVGN